MDDTAAADTNDDADDDSAKEGRWIMRLPALATLLPMLAVRAASLGDAVRLDPPLFPRTRIGAPTAELRPPKLNAKDEFEPAPCMWKGLEADAEEDVRA